MMSQTIRVHGLALLASIFLGACNTGGEDPADANDAAAVPPPANSSGGGDNGSGNGDNGATASEPTPYLGSPHAVPGRFNAVDFDNGGENVAYHDSSAGNSDGRYRPDEDVDITDNPDSEGGDFQVNHFQTGEWLKYSIDVASDGNYSVDLRLASAFSNSAFRIEIDGEDVTGQVRVPNTGGWEQFNWIGRSNIPLTAGSHELTVVADTEYFNVNAVRVEPTPDSGPFHGSAVKVPGSFEAEDYDYGGTGVAFHDSTDGNAGGQYRSDDVDIEMTRDTDGGLYDVVDIAEGDWTSYQVDVTAAGDYQVAFRAMATNSGAALRFEIDGQQVGGTLTAPEGSHGWVTSEAVSLAEGTHVLRVIGAQPGLRLNRIEITEFVNEPAAAAPYHDTPLPVPGIFQAEDFDKGGEGLGYSDTTTGNTGGQYRTDEDVDIAVTADPEGGNYDIDNIESGEWQQWTLNVTTEANYDIELRTNSAQDGGAFRIEVDGQDVSGRIEVPASGSDYPWTGGYDIPLKAGEHVLRVVAEQGGFRYNSIRMIEHVPSSETPPPSGGSGGGPVGDPANVLFACGFDGSFTDCGFEEQSKTAGRASIVDIARDGTSGVLLRTEPGDDNVYGSGSAERTDLFLPQDRSDGFEGRESWWAHSIMFPDDYVPQTSGWGVVFDFHNSGSGPWQANFHVDAGPNGLNFRGYGGVDSGDGQFVAQITDTIERNTWYDFVYHVRWSSQGDGFFKAWVNGRLILEHYGPTLYEGQGVYLKLANYHSAFGQASSVIHDRVIRGRTPLSVSDRPLEGVLDIVNGVLTDISL